MGALRFVSVPVSAHGGRWAARTNRVSILKISEIEDGTEGLASAAWTLFESKVLIYFDQPKCRLILKVCKG